MSNKVIIKGNKYGISIVLDPDIEFAELLDELKERLINADAFFDSTKQIAASFEGRDLSNEELDKILSIIRQESKLNIQYIIDENKTIENAFIKTINSANAENTAVVNDVEPVVNTDIDSGTENDSICSNNEKVLNASSTGMFYKGTLRSGQKLEAENSIVIIGDVNPGASIIAGGNIVIIGSLTGSVQAGASGNRNCFVIALSMEPIQIQIADIIARSSDKRNIDKKSFDKLFDRERKSNDKKQNKQDAMIATVISDHIYVETISKSAIQDIII